MEQNNDPNPILHGLFEQRILQGNASLSIDAFTQDTKQR